MKNIVIGPRGNNGSAIVLTLALTIVLGMAVLYFGLEYTKQLGAFQEQRVAIDFAALAAAKDLSRIVVEDPYFGFIALSDFGPGGQTQTAPPVPVGPVPAPTPTPVLPFKVPGTTAADGYPMPVRGINTVLATVRVDMIVADTMNDSVMQAMAQQDYNYAIAAQANLAANLASVVDSANTSAGANVVDSNGNPPCDIDGNVVNPYIDAVNAYKSNRVRMSGSSSNLVPGSLKLTLGYVPTLYTSRAPVPQPNTAAQIANDQQAYGYYLPAKTITYKGKNPMVFAALGSDTTLVDGKTFTTTYPGANLPNAITPVPTVVFCDADQQYIGNGPQGDPSTRTVHATSCSLCSCISDQLPNPGAFTITFFDSLVPEVTAPGDLFNLDQITKDPTDWLQTPPRGDYPQSSLTPYAVPVALLPTGLDGGHPQFTYLLSIAYYDWVRRGGATVNVQNLVNMLQTPFNKMAGPQVHSYQMMSDGTINYTTYGAAQVNLSISNNQWRALSGLGFNSTNGSKYDLQITDFVHQPGRMYGGRHGGEPLDKPGVQVSNPNPFVKDPTTVMDEDPTLQYEAFLPAKNNVPRPTYQNNGIAFDFTFRKR